MKKLISLCSVICFTLFINILPVKASTFDSLISQYAYIIDYDTGQVIYEKNAEEKMYPASLTKMMTCIIAIENNLDDKLVTITSEMIDGLESQNAYVIGLKVGDTLPMIDLIYGSAVASGADATNAIALTISSSFDDFVQLMNTKAIELGMTQTHFTNPVGLHNQNHYSTAKDMSILLNYCLQNDEFKQIFSTSTYVTSSINSNHNGITIHSSSKSVIEKEELYLPEFIGGKTGYTIPAGRCLASWIDVNDMHIISITACANSSSTSYPHISDLNTIIQELRTYHKETILSTDQIVGHIKVNSLFTSQSIDVYSPIDFTYDVEDTSSIKTELNLQKEVSLENEEQTINGTLNVFLNDAMIQTTPITVTIPKDTNPFTKVIRSLINFFQ